MIVIIIIIMLILILLNIIMSISINIIMSISINIIMNITMNIFNIIMSIIFLCFFLINWSNLKECKRPASLIIVINFKNFQLKIIILIMS